MNTNKFKLYFEKLDIDPSIISLDLLKEIQRKHLENFSFNNISVLLKQDISLDIDDIIDKIIVNNLGGYCFEHNKLMYEILKSLGFTVRILIAKVLNNQDIDSPRTHRITLVEWKNNQYLIDVGFGATCPQVPLNINDIKNNQDYRIVKNEDNDYQLELLTKEGYFKLYKFNLMKYTEADCIMGNFYSSTYPNAIFINNFVITLRRKEVTLSLRNNTYYMIYKNETKIIEIKNNKQLYLIINNDFNMPLNKKYCNDLFEITSSKERKFRAFNVE